MVGQGENNPLFLFLFFSFSFFFFSPLLLSLFLSSSSLSPSLVVLFWVGRRTPSPSFPLSFFLSLPSRSPSSSRLLSHFLWFFTKGGSKLHASYKMRGNGPPLHLWPAALLLLGNSSPSLSLSHTPISLSLSLPRLYLFLCLSPSVFFLLNSFSLIGLTLTHTLLLLHVKAPAFT
jgi:hypothetical protein